MAEKCKVCGITLQDTTKEICEVCEDINKIKSHIKREEKKLQPKSITREVRIKCIGCNKEQLITTSNPEMYTEEVRKTWKCFQCSFGKKKKVQDCSSEDTNTTIGEQNG